MYVYIYHYISTCVCVPGETIPISTLHFFICLCWIQVSRKHPGKQQRDGGSKAMVKTGACSCFKRQGMCLASSFFGLSLFCFCLKDPRQSAEFSAITLLLGILKSWDSGTYLRTRFLCNVLQYIQTDEMKILEIPIPEWISQVRLNRKHACLYARAQRGQNQPTWSKKEAMS